MPARSRTRVALTLLAVSLTALVACGQDESGNASGGDRDEAAGHDAGADFSWGEPADGLDADRVIEIEANDDFSFEPDPVDVGVGETVTFRVTNTGKLPHDFTRGGEATQDEHEQEMADMADGPEHGEANTMAVEAGETEEMTWTFDREGTVIAGCHVPGHYAAGMRAEIVVSPA